MNENRPHRSACSTDSSRKPSPSPTSLTNTDTGVSTSASTSRQIGTMVCSRASARNSSREMLTGVGPSDGVAVASKERKKHV